jgi:hypothetical protein
MNSILPVRVRPRPEVTARTRRREGDAARGVPPGRRRRGQAVIRREESRVGLACALGSSRV